MDRLIWLSKITMDEIVKRYGEMERASVKAAPEPRVLVRDGRTLR
jgi:hypothetical protein